MEKTKSKICNVAEHMLKKKVIEAKYLLRYRDNTNIHVSVRTVIRLSRSNSRSLLPCKYFVQKYYILLFYIFGTYNLS